MRYIVSFIIVLIFHSNLMSSLWTHTSGINRLPASLKSDECLHTIKSFFEMNPMDLLKKIENKTSEFITSIREGSGFKEFNKNVYYETQKLLLEELAENKFLTFVPKTFEEKIAYMEILFSKYDHIFNTIKFRENLFYGTPKYQEKLRSFIKRYDFTTSFDSYEYNQFFSDLFRIHHNLKLMSDYYKETAKGNMIERFFSERMQVIIAQMSFKEREDIIKNMMKAAYGEENLRKKFSLIRFIRHPQVQNYMNLLNNIILIHQGFIPVILPKINFTKFTEEEIEFTLRVGIDEAYKELSTKKKILIGIDMSYEQFRKYFTPIASLIFAYQIYDQFTTEATAEGNKVIESFNEQIETSDDRINQIDEKLDLILELAISQLTDAFVEKYGYSPPVEKIDYWKATLRRKKKQ